MQTISPPENEKYATLEKVRARLKEKGLTEFSKPSWGVPELPKDLISQGGDKMTEIYRECEGYFSWILWEYSLARETAGEWKNALKLLEKALSKQGLKPEEIETDPRTIALRQAVQASSQEEHLLEVHKDSLDRKMKIASRAVTVLQLNHDTAQRANNIGQQPWKDPR